MDKQKAKNTPGRTDVCPICRKPVDEEEDTYPFCTDRCRLVDLGKWFSGGYAISRPLDQRDLDEGGG